MFAPRHQDVSSGPLDLEKAMKAEIRRAKPIWPISKKGGQTPLKPPFVTPPFAAAQLPMYKMKSLKEDLVV